MKKIILSTLVLFAVASCKKEGQKTDETAVTDSISTAENTESPANASFAKESSIDEVNKILAKKDDTLYVTNFFAAWCGPCIKEIPDFKNKMNELKDKPVKFTFINLDEKAVWNTKVKDFTDQNGITANTIFVDGNKLDQNFFASNFKQWSGQTIPFTLLRKGSKTEEITQMISKEELDSKIASFLQ
jgi:thiol-disulfide isomerase/thioredoxin